MVDNIFQNKNIFIQNGILAIKQNWKRVKNTAKLLGLITSIAIIGGCANSSSPESSQGQIKITMIDAPAAFDEVNIAVTRVEVHKSGADSTSGWFVINNVASVYNLLNLKNGASIILGNSSLDAGHYTQIRLILAFGSNIKVNGITHSLDVSSSTQTGLKLNHEFDILPNVTYELMLDFDAERSITLTGNNQYKLKPVIRLVPVITSGTISGKVNPINTKASILAIRGMDTVRTVADLTTGSFKLMALLQGTYNVKILSGNTAYNDKVINDVVVAAKQNTDLGTITLTPK